MSHKLTIHSRPYKSGAVADLAAALRKIKPKLTVSEAWRMAGELPYEEDTWYDEDELRCALINVCTYTYEYIPTPEEKKNYHQPPWDKPEYLKAKYWYNTLSKEDQEKIDILVRGNVPWG